MPVNPIPSSYTDMERRRLESTLDQSLHSLSLDSLLMPSNTSTGSTPPFGIGGYNNNHKSSDTISTFSIEYPRSAPAPVQSQSRGALERSKGPSGTPRAAYKQPPSQQQQQKQRVISNAMSSIVDNSPVSTAGHHVSQVTLGEGIFRRGGGAGAGRNKNGMMMDEESDSGSEFDPERSLGRLVGELGRVMGQDRPTSPFAGALSPPRSPSPLPTLHSNGANRDLNLSFTLNRNDPLLSPPQSRKSSHGSNGSGSGGARSTFSSLAKQLGNEIQGIGRPSAGRCGKGAVPLGEATHHNVGLGNATPAKKGVLGNGRVKALQAENNDRIRRPTSAPSRLEAVGDVTGMTGLLETPAKGGEYGTLGKNGEVGGDSGAAIPETLAALHARLRALETESSLSRRRVRELEGELDEARNEVEQARRGDTRRLKEVIGEKTALEDLVGSLRSHLARITSELENHKSLITELRNQPPARALPPGSPIKSDDAVSRELAALRREIERLTKEVSRLGGIVEQGLETRRKAKIQDNRQARVEDEPDLLGPEADEALQTSAPLIPEHHVSAPSKLRQGLHVAGNISPTLVPPTIEPPTRTLPRSQSLRNTRGPPSPPASDSSSRNSRRHSTRIPRERIQGPSSPFPSIRAEDEEDFFRLSEDLETANLAKKRQSKSLPNRPVVSSSTKTKEWIANLTGRKDSGGRVNTGELPPQTVLARVLRELEDDFKHYKAIYAELADQYKTLDAASAVHKRHVLADHLREVIDTLEQKADQISSLYGLLKFEDQPLPNNDGDGLGRRASLNQKARKSVHDVMRMVKESLGEDALRRLEADGIGFSRR